MDLHRLDEEEDQLYQWIKKATHTKSMFIDSELFIPIYGQRRLFMGMGNWLKKGFGMRFLDDNCQYAPELLRKRRSIGEAVYGKKDDMAWVRETLQGEKEPIYFVERKIKKRKGRISDGFKNQMLEEVFTTSLGNYVVYQMK
jgi:hypothetical protein